MTLVISLTPLTPAALEQAAGAAGADALTLADLKAAGPRGLRRLVRAGLHRRVVVAGATDELEVYEPVLGIAALLAGAGDRSVFDVARGVRRPLPALRTLASMLAVAAGSVLARRALAAKAREAAGVRAAAARPVAWSGDRARVLYLKSGPFGNVRVGGSVGHVAGVANALRRGGSAVRLLAASRQAEVGDDVEHAVVAAPRRWVLPLELNVVRYSLAYRRAALALARRWRPTLAYQRYSPHDLTGAALRPLGIPWVLEYNGSEVWVQRSWGQPMRYEALAREVELTALRSADLVVTVSEPLRREVIRDGVPEQRVLFYPNCIDPTTFDPARFTAADNAATRARFGLAPADFVLTFIGTFGQWHGTDILADAIRSLAGSDVEWLRAVRARFLFAGSGMLAGEVARRLAGLGEFVRLPGLQPQADAPAILAASDVLLSPHKPNDDGSEFFGSPTKLIEYMAMARPVIASDLDQIGDIARGWQPLASPPARTGDSDLMLLARPGDPGDLARAIRQVHAMPAAAREAMGARARAAVLRGFTWDANVAAVMARLAALASPDLHHDRAPR